MFKKRHIYLAKPWWKRYSVTQLTTYPTYKYVQSAKIFLILAFDFEWKLWMKISSRSQWSVKQMRLFYVLRSLENRWSERLLRNSCFNTISLMMIISHLNEDARVVLGTETMFLIVKASHLPGNKTNLPKKKTQRMSKKKEDFRFQTILYRALRL